MARPGSTPGTASSLPGQQALATAVIGQGIRVRSRTVLRVGRVPRPACSATVTGCQWPQALGSVAWRRCGVTGTLRVRVTSGSLAAALQAAAAACRVTVRVRVIRVVSGHWATASLSRGRLTETDSAAEARSHGGPAAVSSLIVRVTVGSQAQIHRDWHRTGIPCRRHCTADTARWIRWPRPCTGRMPDSD